MKKQLTAKSRSKNGDTPMPCPVCSKLVFPQGLGVHMKMHRNDEPVDPPVARTGDGDVVMVPVSRAAILVLLDQWLRELQIPPK